MAGLGAPNPSSFLHPTSRSQFLPSRLAYAGSRILPPVYSRPQTLARLDARQQHKKQKGSIRSKQKSETVYEEDIYNIDGGFTVNLQSTKETIELAGVQVPKRLKQQLQQERKVGRSLVAKENITPRSTHKILRVIAGKASGKKLFSPADINVRPMMEVVRGAIFDILQARMSGYTSLSRGRWLDLYSGTGSVGIEALSRGCASAHFVEMDPWVVAKVLKPNLELTDFHQHSVVHIMQTEAFLQKSLKPGYELGSFEYISVTPPYEAVDYSILMGQLSMSSLVGKDTFMMVEYPFRVNIVDSCGPLLKILDRRYGRTHLAIYGPEWALKS